MILAAAIRTDDRIEAEAWMLCKHALLGRVGRLPGTRGTVARGTPYLLVYTVTPDSIDILRVLHGAQRWPPPKL